MKIMRSLLLASLLSGAAITDGIAEESANAEALHAALESLEAHPDAVALKNDPETFARRISSAAEEQTHYSGEDLLIMLYGLSIKGSGGGGGLLDGFSIMQKLDLRAGIDIYDISTAQDDKLYMVVGGLGEPSALKAHLDGLILAIEKSMNKLAELKGKEIGGILSVESGPVNTMLAILLSQSLQVPLIDVDGAGRSVPSLTNLTYAYEQYPVAPVVAGSAVDPTKDVLVSYPANATAAEAQLREDATKLGGLIGIALWGQTGAELKASDAVRHVFQEAYLLGLYTLNAARDPGFLAQYFQVTGNYIAAFPGVLTRFHIDSSGGFDKVYLDIDLPGGSAYTINAVNEDLLMVQTAPQPGVTVTAPHIMAYIVQEDGIYVPYNNGDVDQMQNAAANKSPIYVLAAQASRQLYGFEQSFLDILLQVYGYSGPVIPAYRPPQQSGQ